MTKVEIKLALQGDGVKVIEFDSGTTLGELKRILDLNPSLEFRVASEIVGDDFLVDSVGEVPLVGTRDAKGGIA